MSAKQHVCGTTFHEKVGASDVFREKCMNTIFLV